jgi:DNA-binding CsgD family transcriptional regulator
MALIEAAYRLGGTEGAWLDLLLEAGTATLDRGLGTLVWRVQFGPRGVSAAFRATEGVGVVQHFIEMAGRAPTFVRQGHELALPFATHARRARLRLERRGASDPVAGVDAVVSPGGKIEHADGDARESARLATLRAAARAADKARGRLRRSDPDEPVEIWKGLVSGRRSPVDHSDSDGRRFLIACRNDPAVAAPVALDARERRVVAYRAQGHPLTLIAYELGISIATVSESLSRARAVLGLRDEDFARVFLPPATAPDPKGD